MSYIVLALSLHVLTFVQTFIVMLSYPFRVVPYAFLFCFNMFPCLFPYVFTPLHILMFFKYCPKCLIPFHVFSCMLILVSYILYSVYLFSNIFTYFSTCSDMFHTLFISAPCIFLNAFLYVLTCSYLSDISLQCVYLFTPDHTFFNFLQ